MSRRSRVFALLAAFVLLLVGYPATAYAGSSDELALPPGPSCTEPVFTTTPALDASGFNISDPNLGDGAGGLISRTTISGLDFPSGTVSLDEIVTWDAHTDRQNNPDQTNERVVMEFVLDGVVVATSGATTDLLEGPVSAWEINNLGTIDLPDGADAVNLVHVGGTSAINSVVVTSVCLTFVPTPIPEPVLCDDGTVEPEGGCPVPPEPDDQEPEPEPVLCDDGTVEPEGGCPVPPEPDDQDPEPEPAPPADQEPPPLAITGAFSDTMAAAAMILILVGGSTMLVVRRNED